jgi:ATPase components of ABC transporters with duplicated ATPase domains
MNLIEFENVTKQIKNQSIFNNISLKINSKENIGLKMSHTESSVFFDLLEQNTLPSAGSIISHTQNISTNVITMEFIKK